MSNVIEVDFTPQGDIESGHYTEGFNDEPVGVYVGKLAATISDGKVVIGTKDGFKINNAFWTTKKEMNELCIMWLSLYDPTAIKYDEER